VFVAKLGAMGEPLWSIRGGGAGYDSAFALAVDRHDDPLVTGVFSGGDLGGGPLTYRGGFDVFVARYAGRSGAHAWSRGYGGADDDRAFAISVDGSGRVAVSGDFGAMGGAADFGGVRITSAGLADAFLMQLRP